MKSRTVASVLFYSLSLVVLSVNALRSYKIHIDTVKVDLHANDTLEVRVNLLNDSRGEQVIDMEYIIKEELPTAYIRALAKMTNRNTEFVFINKTINVCKFFQQTTTSVIMSMIYDEMTKKGLNMNSCPIQVGSYYSRGFHVNDNRFPPIVPQGRVHMKIEQFTGPSEKTWKQLTNIEITATIRNNLARAFRIKG